MIRKWLVLIALIMIVGCASAASHTQCVGYGCLGISDTDQFLSTWYDHNVTSSDIAGYYVFNRSYPSGIEGVKSATTVNPGTEYLIASFASEPGDPGLPSLPAGERRWDTYAKVDSLAGGNSYITIRLYARTQDGAENELYNLTTGALSTTIERDVTTQTVAYDVPMNITDRFVVKYYAKTNSAVAKVITLYFDDALHTSKAYSPIPSGVAGPQGPPGPAGTTSHNLLLNLTTGDDHPQYAYLPGRAGGQVWTCGTGANDDCYINGTSSSTKTSSYVILQPDGGNVGIRTNNPTAGYTLDVNGAITANSEIRMNISQANNFAGGFVVYKRGNSTISSGTINDNSEVGYNSFYGWDGSAFGRAGYILYRSVGAWTPANRGSSFSISTTQSGTTTNVIRLFLSDTGYIGLGTTSPSTQLHTTGGVRFANFSSGTLMVDASGNLYTASDEKLKNNIKPLKTSQKIQTTTAAQKISALNPVTFKFGASSGLNTDQVHTGFIAQEVEKIIPEAVSTKADIRYEQKLKKKGATPEEDEYETVEIPTGTYTKSLDDRAIIATMVLAMQEQQAEIDDLKSRIEKLEKKS